jgi:hypothetical protein
VIRGLPDVCQQTVIAKQIRTEGHNNIAHIQN